MDNHLLSWLLSLGKSVSLLLLYSIGSNLLVLAALLRVHATGATDIDGLPFRISLPSEVASNSPGYRQIPAWPVQEQPLNPDQSFYALPRNDALLTLVQRALNFDLYGYNRNKMEGGVKFVPTSENSESEIPWTFSGNLENNRPSALNVRVIGVD